MVAKTMKGQIVQNEIACCVDQHTCKDHEEDTSRNCVYTKHSSRREVPENEIFEEAEWKDNCCQYGFKCSDVTGDEVVNAEFCERFEKYYDESFAKGRGLLTENEFEEVEDHVFGDQEKLSDQDKLNVMVANLCCIDVSCEEKSCETTKKDARLKVSSGTKIPFETKDEFSYCCGYDCKKVDCEKTLGRLELRDLQDREKLRDSRDECCDSQVTRCFEINDADCGEGFMKRQYETDFEKLIYKDEIQTKCCEKRTHSCQSVKCENFGMLKIRDLGPDDVKYTPEDCCDDQVTTCRKMLKFLEDEQYCGKGLMIRQDQTNFDGLIYKDTIHNFCCEKEITEEPPPKKKCCERKAPLVNVRVFQSPTTILQPQYAVDSSFSLRGALEELSEEVDRYVGDDSIEEEYEGN